MDVATTSPPCPKCGAQTESLAREGEKQRFECTTCSGWLVLPAADVSTQDLPQGDGTSAPPAAPIPAASNVKGTCPKCTKPYMRLGLRYDEHVKACDGKQWLQKKSSSADAALPADANLSLNPGTAQAIKLSIEALKAQRSALEGEIRGINGAIATLEKIGLGGGPEGPFAGV